MECIIGAEYTMTENELVDLYEKLIALYEFKLSCKIENFVFELSENILGKFDLNLAANFQGNTNHEIKNNDPEIKIKEIKAGEGQEAENKILFFLRKRRSLFKLE